MSQAVFMQHNNLNSLQYSKLIYNTPIKEKTADSDQESTETNDSIPENSSQIQNIFDPYFEGSPEIDVKPKRKYFATAEQKQKFKEDYLKKLKTEICKNWQSKGTCPYGDKCCFAHGYNELKFKSDFQNTYKTKPCKKFFQEGYCPYGHRCQYLHSDINYLPKFENYLENLYKEKQISLPQQKSISYIDKLNEKKQKSYNITLQKQRLPVFSKLERENIINIQQQF